ncbi:MAG: D-aminoacyl-tRNA deacylase, partial [Halobacteriaceae archaeon]
MSRIGIVISREDIASLTIKDALLERVDWEEGDDCLRYDRFELRTFDRLHLHLNEVALEFNDPDLLIFASRHSGDSGALCSTHFTGNFGTADFGGRPMELAKPAPRAVKRVLNQLERIAPAEYDVSMECTHHGPSNVGCPSFFVELGSDETRWSDERAATSIARSILELDNELVDTNKVVTVFGDGHYAPRSTRIVTETDWSVGHVAADWATGDMTDKMIQAAFDKSNTERAVVERDPLAERISNLGYDVVSERWIRETEGVALGFVQEVEDRLGSIDDGVRLGEPAKDQVAYEIRTLPDELLREVNGIDPNRVLAAAREAFVAFETAENGNKLKPRVAAPSDSMREFVEKLCSILASKYDVVDWTSDDIIVKQEKFDASAAADLGVPEGPKFGKLAAGE